MVSRFWFFHAILVLEIAWIFFAVLFHPVLEISYRTVRTFSESHFGGYIIRTVFGVFSCSDDVILSTTVEV